MFNSTPLATLHVHLLPEMVHPHELAGETVVIVDVLRASTTIVAGLAAGACQIVPCLEVAEARQLARDRAATARVRLGGERQGQLIPGFDLGNAPEEYTAATVGGAEILFTTTNGTKAMMRCTGAGRVLVGCFVNLQAVVQRVQQERVVHIVCAGTEGQVSWEDALFAGAMAERLLRVGGWHLNDAAQLAHQAWRQLNHPQALTPAGLAEAFRQGQGGRNLLELDRAPDLAAAAQLDSSSLVPELSLSDWAIRPAG